MKMFIFCKKYLLLQKDKLIIFIFFTLCMTIISLYSHFITGNFIDNLITLGTLDVIIRFCIVFIIVNFSGIIIGYINSIIYAKLRTTMVYELNKDAINHMQNLSLTHTNMIDNAYLSQRVNSDSNELIVFCIMVLQNIINNITMLIIPLIIMIKINWFISLFLIFFLMLYVVLYLFSRNILFRTNYALKEQKDIFFSKLHEQFKYSKLIKLHSIDLTYKLHNAFVSVMYAIIKSQKVNYIFYGADNIVKNFARIILFLSVVFKY